MTKARTLADFNTTAIPAAVITGLSSGGTNAPAFDVKLSSNQDIGDASSATVAFNSESIDTDTAFNSSTYRFTPQTAGNYFITFTLYAYPSTTAATDLGKVQASIRKNGSGISAVCDDYGGNDIAQGCVTTSAVVALNGSTDYIDFEAEIDVNSGTGMVSHNSRVSGYKLA